MTEPLIMSLWTFSLLVPLALALVCVPEEENSGASCSLDIDITIFFIAQKDNSSMIKCKLRPQRSQPHYAADTSSVPANAKLAKNSEWC